MSTATNVMFHKACIVLVFLTALGVWTLHMRQQRYEALHEMANLHREIDQLRHEAWDKQTRVAEFGRRENLEAAINRAGLELEPIMPDADDAVETAPLAAIDIRHR